MLYDKLEHLLLRTTIIQNTLIITPKVCVLTVMIWSCNNNKLYYLISVVILRSTNSLAH